MSNKKKKLTKEQTDAIRAKCKAKFIEVCERFPSIEHEMRTVDGEVRLAFINGIGYQQGRIRSRFSAMLNDATLHEKEKDAVRAMQFVIEDVLIDTILATMTTLYRKEVGVPEDNNKSKLD